MNSNNTADFWTLNDGAELNVNNRRGSPKNFYALQAIPCNATKLITLQVTHHSNPFC